MKCAVIIVVGPGDYGPAINRCKNSVNGAIAHSRGPFSDIAVIEAEGKAGAESRAEIVNSAVAKINQEEFDWLLLLDADGFLFNETFKNFNDKFTEFDALWGFIADYNIDNNQILKRDRQLVSATFLNQIAFSHPYLTLGFSHFVKTKKFVEIEGFVKSSPGAEEFNYFLRLWSSGKCAKFDLPLSALNVNKINPWGVSEGSKEWVSNVALAFSDFFTRHFANVSFELGGQFYTFNITNSLEHIQQYHIARTFFELKELEYIKGFLKPGSVVLDVGANIGNHTIYLAKNIPESRYLCYEPNAEVADHLQKNLMLNDLAGRVEVIRKAVGESDGFVFIGEVDILNQGATKVCHGSDSGVGLVALDTEKVVSELQVDFIKVDVEGFENEVIRGARLLINRCKPLLFVEVANENKGEFNNLISELGYKIDHEFRNVHASNFVCVNGAD